MKETSNLNELSKLIYESNKRSGFNVAKENIGQTLMLIVSELSEALEADRIDKHSNLDNFNKVVSTSRIINKDPSYNGGIKPETVWNVHFRENIKDTFEDEIADTFIRLFDLCGALNIDIETHINLKLKYNDTREYRHKKRY